MTRTALGGMVATVDHLATGVGVDLLRRGGSAADAAVGANAVLAVVAPHMCGPGGDVWALVHDGGSGPPAALDGSGFAGSGADADRMRAQGHSQIPLRGSVASVTVPGAVDGWLALHDRYGRLPLAEVFAEAIRIADNGFAASPLLAARAAEVAGVEGNTDIGPDLAPGAAVCRPGTARALRAIVKRGRDGFYGGEFGEGLLSLGNGEYAPADLQTPIARWVDPVRVEALSHVLWTVPPASQGYLTLASAWIADGLELPDAPDGLWAHLLVEAAAQAAHDRVAVLHDGADAQALVAPDRLASRRAAIDAGRAANLVMPAAGGDTTYLCAADADGTSGEAGAEGAAGDTTYLCAADAGAISGEAGAEGAAGDTTYLCAADADGMGVSLINSNASGFGAHLVAGTTGIFVHDRGIGFSLERGHPAEYGPGRRPPHTLSPALVTTADGSLRQVLGTMGGDSQPQVLLQLLDRTLRLGQSPGEAISAPRWVLGPADRDAGFDTWNPGQARRVLVEDPSTGWAEALRQRGHTVAAHRVDRSSFGHAQMIAVTGVGALAGAADPRALIGAAAGL